jgi:hypothetical protein
VIVSDIARDPSWAGTLLQVNKTMLDYKGLTLEEMKGGELASGSIETFIQMT